MYANITILSLTVRLQSTEKKGFQTKTDSQLTNITTYRLNRTSGPSKWTNLWMNKQHSTALEWSSSLYKPWPGSQINTINLARKSFRPFTIIETSWPFYILNYLKNLIFLTACFRLASPLESLGKRMRDGYGRSFGSWPWQKLIC